MLRLFVSLAFVAVVFVTVSNGFPDPRDKMKTHIRLVEENTDARVEFMEKQKSDRQSVAAAVLQAAGVRPQAIDRGEASYGRRRRSPQQPQRPRPQNGGQTQTGSSSSDDRQSVAAAILQAAGVKPQAVNSGGPSYGRRRRRSPQQTKPQTSSNNQNQQQAQASSSNDRQSVAAAILQAAGVKPQAVNSGGPSYGRRRRRSPQQTKPQTSSNNQNQQQAQASSAGDRQSVAAAVLLAAGVQPKPVDRGAVSYGRRKRSDNQTEVQQEEPSEPVETAKEEFTDDRYETLVEEGAELQGKPIPTPATPRPVVFSYPKRRKGGYGRKRRQVFEDKDELTAPVASIVDALVEVTAEEADVNDEDSEREELEVPEQPIGDAIEAIVDEISGLEVPEQPQQPVAFDQLSFGGFLELLGANTKQPEKEREPLEP